MKKNHGREKISHCRPDGGRDLRLIDGNRPCFMIYSSAEKGGYPIRDGEKLMEELLVMFAK